MPTKPMTLSEADALWRCLQASQMKTIGTTASNTGPSNSDSRGRKTPDRAIERRTKMKILAVVASLLALPVAVHAAPDGSPRHGPPPEAVAACNAKAAGDGCTLTFHEHTVSGVCRATPDGQSLACRPPPPQAAIDACAGRAANDSCEMSFPDGRSATGTCRSGHDGDQPLACHPAHHAGEHGPQH